MKEISIVSAQLLTSIALNILVSFFQKTKVSKDSITCNKKENIEKITFSYASLKCIAIFLKGSYYL